MRIISYSLVGLLLLSHSTSVALSPLFPSSAFNMKISEDPAIAEKSSQVIDFLATNQAGEFGFIIGVAGWTYPIFYADDSTPTYDITFTENYSEDNILRGVPIPDNAIPDPQDDGHMVIIDKAADTEYDYWMAKKTGDTWTAGWGNKIFLSGDGVYPHGLSARGSGFAASQGLVWPEEIDAGRIEHALFFSIDDKYVKAGGPISPASESDGGSTETFAIPEGARLQLDPSIDLSTLDLLPYELTIATAMQNYGIILGDRGGGIQFYAARPDNYDWSSVFDEIDQSEGFSELFNAEISIKDFRLLEMGCQYSTPEVGKNLPVYHMYAQGEKGCEEGSSVQGNSITDDKTAGRNDILFLMTTVFLTIIILRRLR